MDIEIKDKGAFSSALVRLENGESFISESGAMYRCSVGIDVDVTTKSKGRGGILSGLKRLLGGEHFFFSKYSASTAGEVGLAPTHLGSVRKLNVTSSGSWICAGGSYLGNSPGVGMETTFQGMKGLFTGESIFFMEATGSGDLLVSAYGNMHEQKVEGQLLVDTGHVVAFEKTLDYKISKAGGSWIQSFFAGEGIALLFEGSGRILTQSHNPNEFGKILGPKLPPRSS